MDGLTLVQEARAAGLNLRADGGRLVIRGPRSAEPMALLLIERKSEILSVLSRAGDSPPESPYGWRIYSKLLGEEVWLVENDADATSLEAELVAERDQRPVFTVPEVEQLAEMGLEDAREAGRVLARVKRTIPGWRLNLSGRKLLDG
jgi:hypothetical protein